MKPTVSKIVFKNIQFEKKCTHCGLKFQVHTGEVEYPFEKEVKVHCSCPRCLDYQEAKCNIEEAVNVYRKF